MSNKWGLESCFIHSKNYFLKELEQIKELGFDGAAIIDPEKFTLVFLEIKKGFKDSGLSLLQIHSGYYNIAHPGLAERQEAVEWYKKRIGYALELEAEEMVVYPGGQDMFFANEEEKKGTIQQNAGSLRKITKEARGTNLKISLENVRGELNVKPSQLVEVVRAVREDGDFNNIGICLNIRIDIPDAFDSGVDAEEVIFEIGEYINSVRLQQRQPLLVGRGPIKWNRVMKAFQKINYSGPFILEVERWQEHTEAMMDNIRYFDRLAVFKNRLKGVD